MRLNLLVLIGAMMAFSGCTTTEEPKAKMTEAERKAHFDKLNAEHAKQELESINRKIDALKKLKNEAIEEAREFALEEVKGLDEVKMSYIRHVAPHVNQSLILNRVVHTSDVPYANMDFEPEVKALPAWDQMQTVMTWYPPNEKQPVVVMGTSKRDLSWFVPVKVVRDRAFIPKSAEEKALVDARQFAMETMLHLQDRELYRNLIRFENPVIADTNYDVDVKTSKHYEELDRKQKYILDRQVTKQASFIWSKDGAEEAAVISGVWFTKKQVFGKRRGAAKEQFMSNWIPVKSQMIPKSEVTKYLVK